MSILLILAHPDPGSFNAAIAKRCHDTLVANGHTVFFHDLYAEKFNAVLPSHEIPRSVDLPGDIQQHCDEIAVADVIIIVHPNWWGQPPAILKGWINRVIRPGIAYEFLVTSTEKQRKNWLSEVAKTVNRHYPGGQDGKIPTFRGVP